MGARGDDVLPVEGPTVQGVVDDPEDLPFGPPLSALRRDSVFVQPVRDPLEGPAVAAPPADSSDDLRLRGSRDIRVLYGSAELYGVNCHLLQWMPRRPASYEQQKMMEQVLVQVHTVPRKWGEGVSAFLSEMGRLFEQLGYDLGSGAWRDRKERLRWTYPNVHRTAERHEWIEKVDDRWRSTPAGLAYAQNRPLAPGEWKTHDLHDESLQAFMREVRESLDASRPGSAPSSARGGVPVPIKKIRRHVFFRDSVFHSRAMGITGDENPISALNRASKIAAEYEATRARVEKGCRALLRKAYSAWTGKPPLSRGPIGALGAVLELKADGKTTKSFHKPYLVDNEIRVGPAFTLYAGRAAAMKLSRIRKAWSEARTRATRRFLKPYSEMRALGTTSWEAVAKCRTAIEATLAYPHYPGICGFRRRAREPR